MEVDAAELKEQLSFIENFYQHRELTIYNLGAISKARAAESELRKKEYLNSLTLRWSSLRCPEHNETEVLLALQPPTNIKSVRIEGYPGEYLPSWFRGCDGPEDMSFSELPAATVDNNNNSRAGTIFPLLTEVSIKGCQNLLSLEQFLHPTTSVPAIREIVIADCASVKSPIEWPPSFEKISVSNCPKMTHLWSRSTKKLVLMLEIGFNIDCSSLTFLHIYSCSKLPSIELEKWSLPMLQRLHIDDCECLRIITESEHISRARRSTAKFPLLTHVTIKSCSKLESIDDLLTHECLPAIESITIWFCSSLSSLPTERFKSFLSLKNLEIGGCPRLYWLSGMVLPPSLQTLLCSCGDFSAWSPRCCLKNLTSLESLSMEYCQGLVSIPGDLWSSNLKSLQNLKILSCPDLQSIGGPEAIANIKRVYIRDCPKLMEIEQLRGNPWWN
ncbi:hypothetical protein PVAP13_1KG155710 [Panicum virgatum]|uniref:Uncharacterized protein n=1 Tax=Panicum virgatum TaxID=38727 RepID=A0A8T0X8D5_PANVG|nr:hypothetical protein PVAP13_1KG155710 [Panicum virgatum]